MPVISGITPMLHPVQFPITSRYGVTGNYPGLTGAARCSFPKRRFDPMAFPKRSVPGSLRRRGNARLEHNGEISLLALAKTDPPLLVKSDPVLAPRGMLTLFPYFPEK
jgi:hypothetical protein